MSGASIGPTCSSIWRVSAKGSASGMSCQPKRGTPMSTVTRPSPAWLADQKAAHGVDGGAIGLLLGEQEIGDAARGVAAAFDLEALIVPDAHAHVGARRGLEHDHLVAADAGLAVGDGAGLASSRASGRARASSTTKSLPSPFILRKGVAAASVMAGLYGERVAEGQSHDR